MTNVNVTAGSESSAAWPGLQLNKTYDWYVTVTDQAGNIASSSPRTFTTGVNAAPVANHQQVTIPGDQPSLLTLQASDSNNDNLTFEITNLPVRGLASDFDPDNGTIAYLPAHGYRGLDRISYRASDSVLSSATANLDLTVTAPPDTNTNGIPDAWEAAYGITDPDGDDDGDGQSNLAEYIANTNPTNAASVLKILDAGSLTNGAFGLTWSSIGGTRYRIQYSTGDTNGGIGGPFTDIIRFIDTEMDANPYGTASTQSFTDPGGNPTNKAQYYRIKVVP